MNIVRKEFKSVFKEPMEALGFTYAGNCFYRQINDVIQTLTLSKTKWSFHFQHLILPLCIPLTKALPGGYFGPLEKKGCGPFYASHPFASHPIPFLREYNEQNIQPQMKEGLERVMADSIPMFEKGTDTQSAYNAVIESQQKLMDIYLLHDSALKWMALKNKEYERAYIHQAALVCQNMGLITDSTKEKDILQPEMKKKWETYLEDDPPYLKENRDLLHRIIDKDDAYFDELIEEGTKTTLEFLAKVDKSPCKYGSVSY